MMTDQIINDTISEPSSINENLSSSIPKKMGKWTYEEDEMLKKVANMYGQKHWLKIASHMNGRTSIQCLHRWSKILKPGLIKGQWTPEEDEKLIHWVRTQKQGNKWSKCAQFIPGRSGKQCRERWYNNLNPDVIKGNWTEAEDDKIFKFYLQYGSAWSKIAKFLPGRTENAIKNRFYSTVRKIAADKKKMSANNIDVDNENDFKEEKNISKLIEKHFEQQKLEGKQILPQNNIENVKIEEDISNIQNLIKKKNIKSNNKQYEKNQKLLTKIQNNKNNINLKQEKNDIIEDNETNYEDEQEHYNEDVKFVNLLQNIQQTLDLELSSQQQQKQTNQFEQMQNQVFDFCNSNIQQIKQTEELELAYMNQQINTEFLYENSQQQIYQQPPNFIQDDATFNLKPEFSLFQPQQTVQQQIIPQQQQFNNNLHNINMQQNLNKQQTLDLLNQHPSHSAHQVLPHPSHINPMIAGHSTYPGHNVHQQENNQEDSKMNYLLAQLQSLEKMLTTTRQELLKLETSYIPRNNNNFQIQNNLQYNQNLFDDGFNYLENINNFINNEYQQVQQQQQQQFNLSLDLLNNNIHNNNNMHNLNNNFNNNINNSIDQLLVKNGNNFEENNNHFEQNLLIDFQNL